jgi:hypothetical protein
MISRKKANCRHSERSLPSEESLFVVQAFLPTLKWLHLAGMRGEEWLCYARAL